MSDEWFEWAVAPDGAPEDGCHPLEAQALKDYFRNGTTPAEAAIAITRPMVHDHNLTWPMWAVLMDAILELSPEQRLQTMTLLKAIDKISFTGFGAVWSDCARPSQVWRQELGDAATRETFRQQYQTLAAREAEMVMANVPSIGIDYGLVCIADALESSGAILDVEIPAVYEWVTIAGKSIESSMHAGQKIWVWTGDRRLYKIDTDSAHGAPLDQVRLSFWIERLREIATANNGLDSETRQGANTCAEIMKTWIRPNMASNSPSMVQ